MQYNCHNDRGAVLLNIFLKTSSVVLSISITTYLEVVVVRPKKRKKRKQEYSAPHAPITRSWSNYELILIEDEYHSVSQSHSVYIYASVLEN